MRSPMTPGKTERAQQPTCLIPITSPKMGMENTAQKMGAAKLIAVAVARGIWSMATKKSPMLQICRPAYVWRGHRAAGCAI